MVLDQIGPCLCCNKLVTFSSEEVSKLEVPANLCEACYSLVYYGYIPWDYLLFLHEVRTKLSYLLGEMLIVKKNIESLYLGQQDVEQALLRAA